MSEVTAKGIFDDCGLKNFILTNKDTGESHTAIRSGQKFEVGEFRGTLAQCKKLVGEGKVVHFADDKPEVEKPGLWDHLAPCVLLILHGDLTAKHVLHTLDCMGWLNRDGTPMIEEAKLELKEWESLQDGN
tara:strand:- start:825 stop:1217 length:393 start_codon:yes stop_codon:yes gene_type:complete